MHFVFDGIEKCHHRTRQTKTKEKKSQAFQQKKMYSKCSNTQVCLCVWCNDAAEHIHGFETLFAAGVLILRLVSYRKALLSLMLLLLFLPSTDAIVAFVPLLL